MIFLGRIGKRKGIFDLLKAITNQKSDFRNKLKLIVGGDGDIKLLEETIEQNQIGDMVNFVGWVRGDKKEELLNNSDILILPSYNEGLPISILEGMSFSMPIISTDVGGIPQVVVNNENGKVVKPGDIKGIEEAIMYYLEDLEKVNEHGSMSYKKVSPFFPKNVMNELESIYQIIKSDTLKE